MTDKLSQEDLCDERTLKLMLADLYVLVRLVDNEIDKVPLTVRPLLFQLKQKLEEVQ